MADEAGEKTEKATPKRMKEVREKGELQRSQDVVAWVSIAAAALMIPSTIVLGTQAGKDQLTAALNIAANPSELAATQALKDGFASILPTLGGMLAAVFIAVMVSSIAQGGLYFKKFKFETKQFNLVTGLKQTFGFQAGWQGLKALLKTVAVGLVLLLIIQSLMPLLMQSGGLSLNQLLLQAAEGTTWLLQAAIAAGLALAFVDLFVTIRRNRKRTRMSQKEIKDEYKNMEGDPQIRAQRRSRQLAMSRNRMMAAIADADVVIVNPTHIAVALKYEPGKSAPKVVAKGKGYVAKRIREEAEKQQVPMVRDIPLARALETACKIGQEIPLELYTAVAMVLTFVATLKMRGSVKGVHQMSKPTPVPGGDK